MTKVLLVDYRCKAIFKLPKGIDLSESKYEDADQSLYDDKRVKYYYIRYTTLHIHFKDGTEMEIEASNDPECDFKEGDENHRIKDAYDYGISDDEDEEEEEEEEEESSTPTAKSIVASIIANVVPT